MEIKSIQTKKIYKNIVEQIVYLIREGSLKCGDKLPPERTLAEMLDVSRASLREALSVMEIMGIVDIRPVEDDLIEFRTLLEIAGIRLVIKNADNISPQLEELRDVLNEMELNLGDSEAGSRLDIKFHSILFSMSNNSVLVKVMEYVGFILEKTVKFNRGLILEKEGMAQELLKCHMDIYDAIFKKDVNLAQTAVEKHFELVYRCM